MMSPRPLVFRKKSSTCSRRMSSRESLHKRNLIPHEEQQKEKHIYPFHNNLKIVNSCFFCAVLFACMYCTQHLVQDKFEPTTWVHRYTGYRSRKRSSTGGGWVRCVGEYDIIMCPQIVVIIHPVARQTTEGMHALVDVLNANSVCSCTTIAYFPPLFSIHSLTLPRLTSSVFYTTSSTGRSVRACRFDKTSWPTSYF